MSSPHKHYILPVDNSVDNSGSYPQVKNVKEIRQCSTSFEKLSTGLSTTNFGNFYKRIMSKIVIHKLSTGKPVDNY